MPTPNLSITANSFQHMDGSNLTIMGLDTKFNLPKGASVSAFTGIGTNFDNIRGVVDLKGSMPYKENSILSQNIRFRNNLTKDGCSTQIRYSPLTVSVPVSKDKTTNVYVNPHYIGKYDYNSGDYTHSAGVFAGTSKKLNKNFSVALEAQRYNLQDFKDNSGKNWSINSIISYKF